MTRLARFGALAGVAMIGLGLSCAASAEPRHRHGRHVAAGADRPLTIGHHRGIYRVGNTIVAPGGFSAHGYGYPVATPDERREARNASIRARSSGLYAYGAYGAGGLGFADGGEAGYDNPYYGNAFNSYVGYNGVPTNLAFGPAFANRHIAGDEDGEDDFGPGPSPQDMGYTAVPGE